MIKQYSKQIIVGTISSVLLLALPALAQDYGGQFGPPTNIPNMNLSPSGQNGSPDGVNQGPSEAQQKAMEQGQAAEQKAAQMEQKGAEMQRQGEAKQLEGMKKGATGMEKALKQFESKYAGLEKKGLQISDSTREKLNSVRTNIESIKNAQTAAEVETVDQNALTEKLSSLGEDIGKYSQMAGLKGMLSSMDRSLKTFETRLAQLQKQGVTAPADVTDALAKLKAGLQNIKDAKNPDDLNDVNPDELGNLMTQVNESRPQLEMFAKWPRVLNQADQQLKQFNSQLTKTKTLVDKLSAQGIDLSVNLASFQDDVTKLQTARDAANQLMKDGKGEEAFTKIEEEFFNQLDNVGEHQRVIQQMSNLSRFTAQFKTSMASAKKRINQLAKGKFDTTELQGIYDQALAKGNEIVAMIKAKPIDEAAILAGMDVMENLKQQFQDKADALSGGPDMPWETKTASQFQNLTLPKGFNTALLKSGASTTTTQP